MELGNFIFGNSRGEYPVNREWQDKFIEKLHLMGFDGYGHLGNDKLAIYEKEIKSTKGNTTLIFDNGTFVIMPYYWGDDEELEELPNFIYKPTNFCLSWYKYALRDSYMNQNLSLEQLLNILNKCKKSNRKEI